MQIEYLIAFIAIFTLDSITPGPAVALVMSRGASIGLTRTFPTIAGLVLGDLFLFVLALAGLAALVATLGPYFIVIKWIGICYLLYLAVRLWNASLGNPQAVTEDSGGWRNFGMGMIIPLGNPKAVGFYIALLPAVMDVGQLNTATAIEFGLAIIIIWGGVLTGYAALAAYGRKRYAGSAMQKWLNRASAGAMVGVAGVMVTSD